MMWLTDEWTDSLLCLQLSPEKALALGNLHVVAPINNSVSLITMDFKNMQKKTICFTFANMIFAYLPTLFLWK